jgi:hypothetical protein
MGEDGAQAQRFLVHKIKSYAMHATERERELSMSVIGPLSTDLKGLISPIRSACPRKRT